MSVRQRVLVGGSASVVVTGAAVGWFLAAAPEHAASSVEVDDRAQILDEPTLRAGVDEVRFYEPTTVAVFTHRGGEEALTDDLALNDAVLEHARTEQPDWLSADEQSWADGLYIFAVDPEGRLVGTYFGDDRAVSQDEQLDIQQEAGEDLQAGRWTEGAVTGVQGAADRMNVPFVRSTGGVVVAGALSLATLAGAGAYVGVGVHRARRSRAARASGDAAMASVVRDAEVTELHARLLPEGSRYGGLMLRRYDDYTQGYRELTTLANDVRGIPERDHDSAEAVRRLTAYQEKATSLDRLDDVIADTAALLNRDHGWEQAWHRQTAPVRADLEGVDTLLTDDLPDELRGLPEAQRLREHASASLVELDRLRGDLETREITPDDALDGLRAVRDGLTARLDELAGAAATSFGDDEDERQTMSTALQDHRGRRVAEPTILATADPAYTWFAVSAFRSGFSSGRSEVQQARSASSGGATGGYSSGGGFSGAGSSSRF